MALDADALKGQLNMTADEADALDEAVLTRLVEAAQAHAERILGYALDNTTELPDGPSPDLEHAVLMIAAHWYGEREAVLVGVSGQEIPLGASTILAEHRTYTFGATD